MPTIKIKRTKSFFGIIMPIKIYINNIKTGEISNGQEKGFEIEPGIISFKLKMGIFNEFGSKIQDYDLKSEDQLSIKIKANAWILLPFLPVMLLFVSFGIDFANTTYMLLCYFSLALIALLFGSYAKENAIVILEESI